MSNVDMTDISPITPTAAKTTDRPQLKLRTPKGRAISTTSSLPSLFHDGQSLGDAAAINDDDDDDAEEIATGANTDVDDDDGGYDSCANVEDDLEVARREAWFSSALASAMIESPREVELIRSWRSAIDGGGGDSHWSPKQHNDDRQVRDGGSSDRMVTFQDLGVKHIDLTRLSQEANTTSALATPDTGRKSVSFGVAEVVENSDYFNLGNDNNSNNNTNGGRPSLSRSSSVSKSCLRSRNSSMSEGTIAIVPNGNISTTTTGGARLTSITEPVDR